MYFEDFIRNNWPFIIFILVFLSPLFIYKLIRLLKWFLKINTRQKVKVLTAVVLIFMVIFYSIIIIYPTNKMFYQIDAGGGGTVHTNERLMVGCFMFYNFFLPFKINKIEVFEPNNERKIFKDIKINTQKFRQVGIEYYSSDFDKYLVPYNSYVIKPRSEVDFVLILEAKESGEFQITHFEVSGSILGVPKKVIVGYPFLLNAKE